MCDTKECDEFVDKAIGEHAPKCDGAIVRLTLAVIGDYNMPDSKVCLSFSANTLS